MIALSFTEAADRIKGGLDIVDVVQRHVILKKAGRNYTGLCPFHNDKNPSMSVHREKNLFKCFSCGAGGDAIGFLMRLENKTYGEVIRSLAEEQGIEIIAEGKTAEQVAQQKDIRQKILTLNAKAGQWFQQQLLSHAEAEPVRQYLTRRGIDEAAVHRFGLGFAPGGWENLTQYLKNTDDLVKAEPELLLTAGLANQKTEGSGAYDRFRQRLIIPILDEKGQVVAFGGRALSDEDKPKYLNTPETQVYHKSRLLYGLVWAKDAIRESKSAVIMEGYFDVISAHLAGVTQAVGSCGTALTDQHLKLLTRFGAETIYLAFDSDEAGVKAALSAIHLMEPYLASYPELDIKIIGVPHETHKDPDEFLRAMGGEAFVDLMRQARSYLAFKFDQALAGCEVHTPEGRIKAVNQVVPMLSAIHQPVVRMEMLARMAERIGVSEEALNLEVKRSERKISPYAKKNLQNFSTSGAILNRPRSSLRRNKPQLTDNVTELRQPLLSGHLAAERDLLRLMLLSTECFHYVLPRLDALTFSHPAYQAILEQFRRFSDMNIRLEAIIDQSNQKFLSQGQADHAATLAELALTAEQLGQALGLSHKLAGDGWLPMLDAEATRYQERLVAFRRQQALRQLAQQEKQLAQQPVSPSDVELQRIELQYRMRDQLTQPLHSPPQAEDVI